MTDPYGAHLRKVIEHVASLPACEQRAFKVPTCTCSHAQGDHVSAGSGFSTRPRYGTCRRCDCREFREREA